MWLYLTVFLLSASTLAFEIVLSRLFSITQFYHFAFMTVSLALLGAGASGTVLSVFPSLRRGDPARRLSLFAVLTALATLGSFVLANWLPFDSFAIAWDRRQVLYLASMYLALALPFFFGALAAGWLFSARPAAAARIYTANLIGSAAGCPLALGALATWGGEGTVLFCAWLAGLGALTAIVPGLMQRKDHPLQWSDWAIPAACLAVLTLFSGWLIQRPSWLTIHLSPYKALSQSLQYPGSEWVWSRWDAASRLDRIRSPGIRVFPGLSYAYLGSLPRQEGLTFDGDDLSPLTVTGPGTWDFAGYMPGSLAYRLRPGARALILEARGGSDVGVALANQASQVTAVEPNAMAVEAVREVTPLDMDVRVHWIADDARSFVRRSQDQFDVIQLSLAWPYRPVTSGAYSLAEDYDSTTEAFHDILTHLSDGGLLVATRWLQTPPGEALRLLALAVTSAQEAGLDPVQSIVVLRGYNTVTLLVKRGPWTGEELAVVREFASTRKYDLVVAPGLRPEEANRYNILADDVLYRTFNALLTSQDRGAFYASYPFDVAPPTDDRPFFGHYFKWEQAGAVWEQLGKTWQPFGGAGYYVLVLMLAFAAITAGVLILLPLVLRRGQGMAAYRGPTVVYFAMLGLGFLFIEIPLIQQLILLVGRPTYALAAVLFGLLLSCGLGSLLSPRLPWRSVLVAVMLLAVAYLLFLPGLFQAALGLSLPARFAIGVLSLAPLGLFMGMPFPKGITWLGGAAPDLVPWAWGVNGAVSVVASVLAALLALSAGFTVVLAAGAACYGVALGTVYWAGRQQGGHRGPPVH